MPAPMSALNKALLVAAASFACALAGFALAAAAACSSVQNSRIGLDAPDDSEQQWGPVAEFLDHRCGTLDCHGQTSRNLRIYGCYGLRLSDADITNCSRAQGGKGTTSDEHQATFRSLVGLEPAVMSEVVATHGQHPELLTFVRKARGIEAHKGGKLITPGDDQDVCITSWLAGKTDPTACANAIGQPQFPTPDASTE